MVQIGYCYYENSDDAYRRMKVLEEDYCGFGGLTAPEIDEYENLRNHFDTLGWYEVSMPKGCSCIR